MDIFNYFPENIKKELSAYIKDSNFKTLEEIRIRVNCPIILKRNASHQILQYIVQTEDILTILEHITENSIYAYQREICEGFITLKDGHRVGISRKCCSRK